jgi:pimeloyl-ACP methyl ester carboxylesterase
MDKFIEKLFEKITPHSWILATLILAVIFAVVLIDAKEVSPWTHATFGGLIIMTLIGHFGSPYFQARSKIKIFEMNELYEKVACETEKFKGELVIFNIELNTLDQVDLWKRLIQPEGILKITIFLPAHIFLRLEKKFSEYPKILELFLKGKDKIEIIVYPVIKQWEQIAFALFHPPTETPKPSCILFPKVSPFSSLCPDTNVWRYVNFLHAHSRLVIDACRGQIATIKNVAENTAFSVEEIVTLNEGNPISIPDIFSQHNGNEEKARFTALVKRENDGPFNARLEGSTLHIESRLRHIKVRFFNLDPNDSMKPLLLWLPPWRVPGWMPFTESIDKELSDHYRVAHLHISENADKYTFTGAKLDSEEAIAQIGRLHNELRIQPNKIVLVGVSVGAFVAAEIAKSIESIKSICLLMPAVDLFDALDSFRSAGNSPVELFTRKFYLAKDGFKASQLKSEHQQYFEGRMGAYHLYDLPFRGARCCNFRFFTDNLREFADSGRKLFVGYSEQDSMLKKETMFELSRSFDSLNCTIKNDIEWFHNVHTGVRYDSQVKSTSGRPPQPGIENVVSWLKNHEPL